MSLNLSNLHPGNKKGIRKRQGRGNASGKGNYSGRGLKGQKARSGGRRGLKLRGLRRKILAIPKLGGFKSHKPKMAIVNLENLKRFKDGETIDCLKLLKAGLIKAKNQPVKILAKGKLNKKLYVRVQAFSKKAEQAIVKGGGKAEKV